MPLAAKRFLHPGELEAHVGDRPVAEHVVPARNRIQRHLIGHGLLIGGGRPQPRTGGLDPLRGSAEIEHGLLHAEQRVGAVLRPRALEDIERVVREVARQHLVGGDRQVAGRQAALAGLV